MALRMGPCSDERCASKPSVMSMSSSNFKVKCLVQGFHAEKNVKEIQLSLCIDYNVEHCCLNSNYIGLAQQNYTGRSIGFGIQQTKGHWPRKH